MAPLSKNDKKSKSRLHPQSSSKKPNASIQAYKIKRRGLRSLILKPHRARKLKSRPHPPRKSATQTAVVKNATFTSSELQQIFSLLSQMQRRNKNQHRTSKWWGCLSMLRRAVRDLVGLEAELAKLSAARAETDREDVRRAQLAREREVEGRKSKKEEWVREEVVGRCYVAFSTVVADRQFAVLGVALMGVLAQVGRVVGLPRVRVEEVKGVGEVRTGKRKGEVMEMVFNEDDKGVDWGEVIDRGVVKEEVEVVRQKKDGLPEDRTRKEKSDVTNAAKARKKRKTTNVIDDLFGGLL